MTDALGFETRKNQILIIENNSSFYIYTGSYQWL